MPPTPRILIVEDESLVAYNLARRLTRLGYTVVGRVPTGAEAIHCAMTLCPHVVLMDIHLRGDMNGVEAAQAIRAQRPIPIIFLSAYVDASTIAHLREAGGAAAYLRKPIVDCTLQQTLQRVLSLPQTVPP
jgi:CheY-like chemotaxis protein